MPATPNAISATGDTLLTYALLTQPDPMQAAVTSATLTLVVSNSSSRIVTCASIVVTFLAGSDAKDLLPNPGDIDSIQTDPQSGWSANNSAGQITLTPKTPQDGQIGANGLSFSFSAVVVNNQPGTTLVTIDETAADPTQPQQDRTATIPLPKFPAQFAVSELTADPLEVNSGGADQLMWTGSAATYTMEFDPGSGLQSVPVGNVGPYSAKDLTRFPDVVFTLVVSLTVPGQDQPLITQRQVTVQVSLAPPLIRQFSGKLLQNGAQLELTWNVSGADSCAIGGYPNALNPQSGTITLPRAGDVLAPAYTLTAQNGGGKATSTVSITWGSAAPDVPVGNYGIAIAIAPDNSYVFIGDMTDNAIYVLDAATFAQAAPPIAFGLAATGGLAVSGDSKLLYATRNEDNMLAVIDAKSFTLTTNVPVGFGPNPLALAPNGSALYLGTVDSRIEAFDPTTFSHKSVQLTAPAANLVVSPDSAYVFATIPIDNSLVVVDAQTLQVVGEPIGIGVATSIAVTPDNKYLLIGVANEILVYDATTFQPTSTVINTNFGTDGIAIMPDNSLIFATNAVSQKVNVLDGQTFAPTQAPIPVGVSPGPLAITPNQNNVFVVNIYANTVSVLGRTGVSGGISPSEA